MILVSPAVSIKIISPKVSGTIKLPLFDQSRVPPILGSSFARLMRNMPNFCPFCRYTVKVKCKYTPNLVTTEVPLILV